MERLMVARLRAQGCVAEAWFNGLPVARVTPAAPEAVVPVHEAALGGTNRLELVIGPGTPDGPEVLAPHAMAAQWLLMLPRMGMPVDEAQSRTLAQIDWSCAAGEPLLLPVQRSHDTDLPLRFRFDDSMALGGGRKISDFKTVSVEARIAKAGKAQSSSGDLFGTLKGVKPGSQNLRLPIDNMQP